jgi:hypothetical protein
MVTFQPNLQDQQSTKEPHDTFLVDAFHEEAVAKANKLRTKDVKSYSTCDLNKVQLKLEAILVTQLASVDIITNGQADEVA